MGGLPSETITFDQALRGIWLDADEPLEFDRVRAGMQWLTHWVAASGIRETHKFTEDNRPATAILEGDVLPSRRVRLGDGITVYLAHTVGVEGDRMTRRSLSQSWAFETRSTRALALKTLMTTTAHLQALVSIGTGRLAGFEELTLNHPALTHGPASHPRRYRRSIDYFAQWSFHDAETAPLGSHDMPFTLGDLGGMRAVGRWIKTIGSYGHQLDQMMATRRPPTLVRDRLFNRVAALEGYHKLRITKKKVDLKDRLIECASLTDGSFNELVADVEAWAKIAVRERNNIGHGSEPAAFEASDALFIGDSAYWLFVLCLLREMEAPAAVFDRIVQTPVFGWLKRNLVAVK